LFVLAAVFESIRMRWNVLSRMAGKVSLAAGNGQLPENGKPGNVGRAGSNLNCGGKDSHDKGTTAQPE
jgi:hypothetical protein